MKLLKKLCLKICLRLLEKPDGTIDDERIQKWMAFCFQNQGFKSYIKKRDGQIIFDLVSGAGMAEPPRDDYVRKIGQRFEILRFANECKKAFQAEQKKQQGKK